MDITKCLEGIEENIRRLFKQNFIDLRKENKSSFNIRAINSSDQLTVAERSIVFRFGIHLQNKFSKVLDICRLNKGDDCNKNNGRQDKVPDPLYGPYFIDTEYNRQSYIIDDDINNEIVISAIKSLKFEARFGKSVFELCKNVFPLIVMDDIDKIKNINPDLIFHRRGDQRFRYNIVATEFKFCNSINTDADNTTKTKALMEDIIKMIGYKFVYGYEVVLFVRMCNHRNAGKKCDEVFILPANIFNKDLGSKLLEKLVNDIRNPSHE